mgnify:CR=1 FL=1
MQVIFLKVTKYGPKNNSVYETENKSIQYSGRIL